MKPTIPSAARAVLFDIYGTLLEGPRLPDRGTRMAEVARRFNLEHDSSLDQAFDRAVAAAHRASSDPWPEIDVREIWPEILPGLDEPDRFALEIEDAIHPVKPTSWAADLLDQTFERGLPAGIVSNAQAYTRVLMQRHFPRHWPHFRPDLLAFSYEHRIAKPDLRLFRKALAPLIAEAIDPARIVMIGDSPENDHAPARALGLLSIVVPPARSSAPERTF